MNTEEKLIKSIELLESLIADIEKLAPFIGGVATATADLYREELKKITQ